MGMAARPGKSSGMRAMKAEPWLISACCMSLANCSAANFQLQLRTHLCMPPIISRPLSKRSAKTSKYQAMSPRYSVKEGAVGSQLPKMKPL